MLVVAGLAIGLVLGAALLALLLKLQHRSGLGEATRRRGELVAEAKREAENFRREAEIEAREQAMRLKGEVEQALQERRGQVAKIEERVLARQDELEAKLTELLRREQGLADREIHIKELQLQLKETKDEELNELERISGLTVNEARSELLARSEQLIRHDHARRVRPLEEEAQVEAKRRGAASLVALSTQTFAFFHSPRSKRSAGSGRMTGRSMLSNAVRRHPSSF
jgi:ribonucrease Y